MKELMSSGISPRYSISLYSRGGIVEKFDSILISGLITVSKAKRAMMETKEISRLFTYSAYAASKFSSPAKIEHGFLDARVGDYAIGSVLLIAGHDADGGAIFDDYPLDGYAKDYVDAIVLEPLHVGVEN